MQGGLQTSFVNQTGITCVERRELCVQGAVANQVRASEKQWR